MKGLDPTDLLHMMRGLEPLTCCTWWGVWTLWHVVYNGEGYIWPVGYDEGFGPSDLLHMTRSQDPLTCCTWWGVKTLWPVAYDEESRPSDLLHTMRDLDPLTCCVQWGLYPLLRMMRSTPSDLLHIMRGLDLLTCCIIMVRGSTTSDLLHMMRVWTLLTCGIWWGVYTCWAVAHDEGSGPYWPVAYDEGSNPSGLFHNAGSRGHGQGCSQAEDDIALTCQFHGSVQHAVFQVVAKIDDCVFQETIAALSNKFILYYIYCPVSFSSN